MKVITSKENPTYREALKLLRRKHREDTGSYLLEGVKPVKDALEAGNVPEKLFIREDYAAEDGRDTETVPGSDTRSEVGGIAELISRIEDGENRAICLSRELFDRLSDTENSQGVIALIKRSDMDARRFMDRACKGNILLLDRLQDPGNAGTMIRTAEAAGFAGIVALKGTTDLYAPKVVRAAAGSILRMPILTGTGEDDALRLLKEGGWKIAVTTPDGGTDCFDMKVETGIALIKGNEGSGASRRLIEESDLRLMIPMEGQIESLNAAVAAGILMYQVRNAR